MADPGSMSVLSLVATSAVVILLAGSTISFTSMIDQANVKTTQNWIEDNIKPRVKDICTGSDNVLPPSRNLTRDIPGDTLEIGTRGTGNNHIDDTYTFVMKEDNEVLIQTDLIRMDDCNDNLNMNVEGDLNQQKKIQVFSDGNGARIEVR